MKLINNLIIKTLTTVMELKILWMEGILTIASWKKTESDEPEYEFYQLNHDNDRTAFVTQIDYFSAGFGEMFSAFDALKGNVSIPVKCLSRVMWHVDAAKNYTACPYLIIEC